MSKMTIRKLAAPGALAIGMMGLAACSGGTSGTQDVGDKAAATHSRAFHARAIDGYLAGATVYVDLNQNNRLDAFEPRAITDKDGYFSYNHDSKTDYCANGPAEHCLRGNIAANEEVVIRVTGGYDTVTGLPFKGVLSLRSSDLNRDNMRVVTPITSMLADSSPSEAQATLQALIDAGIVDPNSDDPMLGRPENMARVQAAALITRMIVEVGKIAYPGKFDDVESDALYHGYIAMASQLVEAANAGGAVTFASEFSSPENIEKLATRVIFSAVFPGQLPPAGYVLPNRTLLQPLFEHIAGLVSLTEAMIAALNGGASHQELLAILRAQAVLVERVVANPYDPEVADLANWIRNQLVQGLGLGSDLTALGGENIDLGTLIARDFDFDPTSNTISVSATVSPEAASTFAALVNTSFGLDIKRPDEQGAAVFFVSGDAGARSGKIDVCVRYRGVEQDFDTTSSSDPNGALSIGGRWSLLNDHTLTLSVDIVGGVRSLLLKVVGAKLVGGVSMRDYRFDFGGGLSEWSGSAPSAFAPGAVPTSDAACRDALIDRFGPMT